jgi:hypothetical protein
MLIPTADSSEVAYSNMYWTRLVTDEISGWALFGGSLLAVLKVL